MEESNMSENDVVAEKVNDDENGDCEPVENPKRLKTDSDSTERSDESNSKESIGESLYTLFECASTSNSDSGFLGFPKTKNAKNRNYRGNKNKEDDENEGNDK